MIKQSAIYLAGRILPSLINLGGTMLFTRVLDPASMGRYATLLAIALLFSGICCSWLRLAVLRDLSGGDCATINGPFARRLFACSAAPVVGGVLLSVAVVTRLDTMVLAAVLAVVLMAWFDLCITVMQARLQASRFALCNLARAATVVAVSLGCIRVGLGTTSLFLGLALGSAVVLLVPHIWPHFKPLSGEYWKSAKDLLRFGWPASFSFGISQAGLAFDRSLVTWFAGAGSTGVYAVGFDLSRQSLGIMISAISLAGLPLAFRAFEQDSANAARAQLARNGAAVIGLGLPAAVGLAMISTSLARTLLGAAFQVGASSFIATAAAATFLNGLRTFYFDHAFELTRRTQPQAIISAISAAAGMLASLALVPSLGAYGAACSALLAAALGLAISIAWGRKIFLMPIPPASCGLCALATATMGWVLAYMPVCNTFPELAFQVIVAGLSYVGVLGLLVAMFRTRLRAEFSVRAVHPFGAIEPVAHENGSFQL